MKRYFIASIVFDDENDPDASVPTDEQAEAALEHSTAREALSEATGCAVSMRLLSRSTTCPTCGSDVRPEQEEN